MTVALCFPPGQWDSTVSLLQPFNHTVPHAVAALPLTIKLILLLLPNCDFAVVMNPNVNV